DLLVLAELPIGGLQVGEVDAAERLALADRLRIVQGGSDEVVDVEFLDVEGLERAGAAGAQELRHLPLGLVAVEPGLERVRRGGDLTERQGGGKDLDQERFHRTLRKLETLRETLAARDLGRHALAGVGATKRAFWRVLFPRRENLLPLLRTGRRR